MAGGTKNCRRTHLQRGSLGARLLAVVHGAHSGQQVAGGDAAVGPVAGANLPNSQGHETQQTAQATQKAARRATACATHSWCADAADAALPGAQGARERA